MGTVSRVHTFASGAILTAAQLNNEFDNLLTSSAINGGLDATNLGVTAGQATASKALVVDASRNLADATGSNRINNLALSGTFESTGAITASAGITSGGNIVSDTDSTDDLGTTGVRWANLFVDDVTVTNNVTIGGTLTLTGGITLNGNTTIGDSSADTLTVNSTVTSNLIFTDNTYDIGASGATRPRNLYLSGNGVVGGTLGVTGLITASGGVSGALTGNVTGNVTGDVTGDVTGNLTGNVTGNVTGNLTGDVTGNISGNVTGGTISGTTGTFTGGLTGTTATFSGLISGNGGAEIGSNTAKVKFYSDSTYSGIYNGSSLVSDESYYFGSGDHFWYSDGAVAMKIDNGDLAVDTDTLFVDASADRVGVNTSSADASLHIIGSAGDPSAAHSSGNAQLILENNGQTYLEFATGTTHYSGITFSDDVATRGAVVYDHGTALGGGADSLHFQTAGSIKAVITSAGNVGIGTTSPSCRTHIRESTLSGFTPDSNTNLAVEENSTSMIEIAGTDSGILFSDASAWAGRIFYTHSTDQMAFATAQSNKMWLTSAGNLGLGTASPVALSNQTSLTVNGTSVGRVDVKASGGGGGSMFGTSSALTVQANSGVAVNLDSASGQPITFQVGSSEKARILASGGITFNGDTAAANALDDYEEGTYSVTDQSGAGLSFTVTSNRYVKIGKLVWISIELTYPTTTNTAGVRISLPFTNSTAQRTTMACVTNRSDVTVSGYVSNLPTAIGIIESAASPVAVTNASLSGKYVIIGGVYEAA